ncbi:MAG: cupin domain-containing protein [Xanthomonadales bacterium]|nr:cupin domain-containing protein [Xanthomonadales bacterium]
MIIPAEPAAVYSPLPTSIHSAEHYRWGEACDGWHLLASPALSVIQERVPAGAAEVRHRHQRAEQFFYVLAGQATLEIEGQVHQLQVGEGLHVPAGAAHRLNNAHTDSLEFLVVSTPPSRGDRELAPC